MVIINNSKTFIPVTFLTNIFMTLNPTVTPKVAYICDIVKYL